MKTGCVSSDRKIVRCRLSGVVLCSMIAMFVSSVVAAQQQQCDRSKFGINSGIALPAPDTPCCGVGGEYDFECCFQETEDQRVFRNSALDRAAGLGFGWYLDIMEHRHAGENPQTLDVHLATELSQATDRGLIPILRACGGSGCANDDNDVVIANLNRALDDADFPSDPEEGGIVYIIAGSNEPEIENHIEQLNGSGQPCVNKLPDSIEARACANGEFMKSLIAEFGDDPRVRLLSPAFNCSHPNHGKLVEEMFKGYKQDFLALDGIALNVYNESSGTLTDHLEACIDSFAELEVEDGEEDPRQHIVLTEIGMIEIDQAGVSRTEALARLREQVALLCDDGRVEGALFFNSFGMNEDQGFQYNVIDDFQLTSPPTDAATNDAEWDYIFGGPGIGKPADDCCTQAGPTAESYCELPLRTDRCPMTLPGGYCDPDGDQQTDDADLELAIPEFCDHCNGEGPSCSDETSSVPIDAVLIIDSSGSMADEDPSRQRVNAAKVYLDVSTGDDQVALIDFDDRVKYLSDLRPLTAGNKAILSALIETVNALGGTEIGAAVLGACTILEGPSTIHDRRAAILLTDGVGTYNGTENACFVENPEWTLHAFGFGDADLAQLNQVVSGTGGSAQMLPQPESIICEFQRLRASLGGATPPPCESLVVQPAQTVTSTQTVPPSTDQVSFSTAWPGSDVVMSLTAPSGRVIDRATVAPDVSHQVGPTFEVYTVIGPEPGVWQVDLFGADVAPGGEPVTFGFSLLGVDQETCEPVGEPGDEDYCSVECPCGERKGDCDGDLECRSGLTCVTGVGAAYGYDPDVDVCRAGCHDGFPGGWDFCSETCPCDESDGDCDSDLECQTGLFCAHGVGASYGYAPDVDVCRTDCHDGHPGDWGYCTEECPCAEGEGDCGEDTDCLPGLSCSHNVGELYGWDPDLDVCRSDCHDGFPGEWGYCEPECPCDAGEGDCNDDADCTPGLTCRHNVGGNYGWPSSMDVCEP